MIYEIENNITDYKELFDNTSTLGSNVIMCHYNENFKGNSNFTNKSFSIFPYIGTDSLGFMI